jgi:hypothetical protein
MAFAESRSDTVPVHLSKGAIVKVEVAGTRREDVGFDVKQFQPIANAIEVVVQMIAAPIQKVKPKRAMVKFGIELTIESGQLTAVTVKGSGK